MSIIVDLRDVCGNGDFTLEAYPDIAALFCAGTTKQNLSAPFYAAMRDDESQQCALIRDVFGNPFRRTKLEQRWLRWNDRMIARLAQTIYDERQFDQLPILADALEEAGCTNAAILEHCRAGGTHVRGCWVVDLVLRKK